MEIRFGKSNWEVSSIMAIEEFVFKARLCGFDAVELYLPWLKESPSDIAMICDDHGLDLIAHISSEGASAGEHVAHWERWFDTAIRCGASRINSHTGRDFFSFEANLKIFDRTLELARNSGIPTTHETHRGRALFAAHACGPFLKLLPELMLTADFSHWVCVAESDLRDQQDVLDRAIARVGHVHARVGYDQGPQVRDPRGELSGPWLARFKEIWIAITVSARERGMERIYFTPEFGPPPYADGFAWDTEVVSKIWEMNLWMRDFLRDALRAGDCQ
jgi:sugar phosphate isomerase/epimerase